jgi:hypothetical protein
MKRLLTAITIMMCALPASAQVTRTGAGPNGAGTIAAAGVSQVALKGDISRSWLICQNAAASTATLFLSFGINNPAATTGGSLELAPGGSISFLAGIVPSEQVNAASATVGTRFACVSGR